MFYGAKMLEGNKSLLLTARAKVSTPASAADFFDGLTTTRTSFTLLTEDFEIVGEVAVITASVFEVLEGGSTNSNRFIHDIAGRLAEQDGFFFCYFIGSPGRSHFSSPQRFINVDITQAGYQ